MGFCASVEGRKSGRGTVLGTSAGKGSRQMEPNGRITRTTQLIGALWKSKASFTSLPDTETAARQSTHLKLGRRPTTTTRRTKDAVRGSNGAAEMETNENHYYDCFVMLSNASV